MFPFERRERLLALLRSQDQVQIGRDAARLGVSRSTLHRDLVELEHQGVVRKVRGGATLDQESRFETHFDTRLKVNSAKKLEIAKKALRVIRDDSSIFLDHSSSAHYLARELKEQRFKNLVVISNSLAVAEELGGVKGLQVILTGGMVESEFRALSGRYVVEFLKRFNLHQIFASCGAVSLDQGLMTQMPFIHELLPAVFDLGLEVNMLIDSSKFHKIGTFLLAPLGPRFRIFSNRDLSPALQEGITATGARLVA